MDTRLLENSEQNKLKGTAPLNYCYRASVQTARKNSNSPTQTKRDGSCELIEKDCTKKKRIFFIIPYRKGCRKKLWTSEFGKRCAQRTRSPLFTPEAPKTDDKMLKQHLQPW